MTMEEIDRLRAELDSRRATYREARDTLRDLDGAIHVSLWSGEVRDELSDRWQRAASDEEVAEVRVENAEEAVEAALREWWAQDCCEEIPKT
jgi:hypothetical protein